LFCCPSFASLGPELPRRCPNILWLPLVPLVIFNPCKGFLCCQFLNANFRMYVHISSERWKPRISSFFPFMRGPCALDLPRLMVSRSGLVPCSATITTPEPLTKVSCEENAPSLSVSSLPSVYASSSVCRPPRSPDWLMTQPCAVQYTATGNSLQLPVPPPHRR
jgi:hypothetical protein